MTARRLAVAAALAALGVSGAMAVPTAAQIADTSQTPVDSVVVTPAAKATVVQRADSVDLPASPRTAFIRSLILPGWGQATFGAWIRAGVYFTGWAGNGFMNVRNYVRLGDARDRLDVRTEEVRTALIEGSPNPDSTAAVLDSVPGLLDTAVRSDSLGADLVGLVDSREQQREDWIAWSIFWILASGVDAYVTAHLADFPAAIDVRPNPDRSLSVRLDVPIPVRRP